MRRVFLSDYAQRTAPIDTLVFHCMAYHAPQGIEVLAKNGVSAHYLIETNGTVFQLLDESLCAYHAGKSFWRGRHSLNDTSIGIELCSESFGQKPYDPRQIAALVRLSHRLIRKYHILPHNIVGHSDIAPARKPDPGKAFPWSYLARHGIGLWYRSQDVRSFLPSTSLPDEASILSMLSKIGYDTTVPQAAKTAFCRHFVPSLIAENDDINALLTTPFDPTALFDKDLFYSILSAVSARF
jgi:N-acetylmuramoyl-L-alanine amidase